MRQVPFDALRQQLHAVCERPSHQSRPVEDLQRSDDTLDEPLRTTPKGFQGQNPQRKPAEEDEPVETNDLRSGFPSYLDQQASESQAEHDRPLGTPVSKGGQQDSLSKILCWPWVFAIRAATAILRESPVTGLQRDPSMTGIHHVTAISGKAARNLEFYTHVLGLRFVKKTVNFDDPGTYHLYYGDSEGHWVAI